MENFTSFPSDISCFEKVLDIELNEKPVSVNKMYGVSGQSKKGGRHIFLNKECDEYQKKIIEKIGFINEVIDYPVKVEIGIRRKTNVKYDIDNVAKPILDAITKSGFWFDDNLVYDLHMRKLKGDSDRICIRVYKI